MLIAHGIVQPDLGIEITSLGIEHVDIVDVAAAILDRRQFDVFDRRIAQALLAFGRTPDVAVGHHRIIGLLEDLQHLFFILEPRLVIGSQRRRYLACLRPNPKTGAVTEPST